MITNNIIFWPKLLSNLFMEAKVCLCSLWQPTEPIYLPKKTFNLKDQCRQIFIPPPFLNIFLYRDIRPLLGTFVLYWSHSSSFGDIRPLLGTFVLYWGHSPSIGVIHPLLGTFILYWGHSSSRETFKL